MNARTHEWEHLDRSARSSDVVFLPSVSGILVHERGTYTVVPNASSRSDIPNEMIPVSSQGERYME